MESWDASTRWLFKTHLIQGGPRIQVEKSSSKNYIIIYIYMRVIQILGEVFQVWTHGGEFGPQWRVQGIVCILSVGEKIQPSSMVVGVSTLFRTTTPVFTHFQFYCWKTSRMFGINSTLLHKKLDDFSAPSIATQYHLEIDGKNEEKQS